MINANSLVNKFVALWSPLRGLWSFFVVIWPLHVMKLLEIIKTVRGFAEFHG